MITGLYLQRTSSRSLDGDYLGVARSTEQSRRSRLRCYTGLIAAGQQLVTVGRFQGRPEVNRFYKYGWVKRNINPKLRNWNCELLSHPHGDGDPKLTLPFKGSVLVEKPFLHADTEPLNREIHITNTAPKRHFLAVIGSEPERLQRSAESVGSRANRNSLPPCRIASRDGRGPPGSCWVGPGRLSHRDQDHFDR